MSSEQLTADDLLSLCARAHGATGRLAASSPSPRLQTLRKLAGFVTDRMTAAALAHEREAISIEVVQGLQDAVQALVFADLLSQIGVDAGGYIRLDRDGLRPAMAPTPAERGLHAGFLEQVDGISAALFVVADELLEVAYAPQTTHDLETEDADEAVQMLADSCAAHLRQADDGEVPVAPELREHGMVWLTFCRRTLERSLAVLETLHDERDEELARSGLIELSRAPGLYRELGTPTPGSQELLELAAAVAESP